jgi:hypothetical protein
MRRRKAGIWDMAIEGTAQRERGKLKAYVQVNRKF